MGWTKTRLNSCKKVFTFNKQVTSPPLGDGGLNYMFTTADKTNTHNISRSQQNSGPAFFRKAGEESFFGNQKQNTFFSNPVQAKLSVSHPDDPQEKEADAVADKVMRMPEPVAAAPAANKEEDKLHRKEEKEEDKKIHPKFESPVISSIERKCEGCKKEEEKVHAKLFSGVIHRSALGYGEIPVATDEQQETAVHRKSNSLYHSDVVQRSGRGPPAGIMHFENNLSSSKGHGTPMPASTQQFMESRFGADFSGVRIHTGSYAENLSSSIHAQAFTHGNDIYFNSGKYSPHTEAGGTLLAHELTHTIQQGASSTKTSTQNISPSIQRKNIIQRVPAGPVPQLTNAVEKAKSKEGKVNAGKEGPDGYREGWQDLLEFFKSTFGADKIISGAGGTTTPGTVAEQDIKKKRTTTGMIVNKADVNGDRITGERDAMPNWCGIFVFWALNKSGVPMPKWTLGKGVVKPEAAYPKGYVPKTGDIAYKDGYSHYAIVESATGDTVKTVNGNTAGEDNLGGQIQTRDHPMSNWTAFFNPLLNMEGTLGSGERPAEKPKTLRELRRELFHVNRKTDDEHDDHQNKNDQVHINTKPELSTWSVNSDGNIHANNNHHTESKSSEDKIQKKDDEKKEEDKLHSPKENIIHKKAGDGRSAEHDCCVNENIHPSSNNIIQQKNENYLNSSLTGNAGAISTAAGAVHARGPPAQISRSKQKIQCGWFDSAMSFVNSAIDFVAEGLEAGKRLLLGEARDFVMAIPGYRALRVVLGEDPITSEVVERNGHNFIEAAFDIMPGGRLLHQKLSELGALTEAEAFVDRRIAEIEHIVHNVISRVETFWNGLTLESLASPRKIFEDAGNIIHSTISEIIDFAVNAASELLSIVKRWLLNQIVDFIRTRTTAYPLLCVILGKDPVTDAPVARNGTNILNALLELGGEEGRQQRTQMQQTGTFQKVVGYIDEGIAVFGNLYQTIKNNFGLIWDAVSIDSLMHPIDTFNRLYETFAEPVRRVWDFVKRVAAEILKLIKEVLLQRLSAWARQQRGYTLLTVIIGKDPFTNERVPFTMENVIRGFFGLMDGGEEQYNQLKQSGAIDRTVAKITAAVAKLNMTPGAIVQLFIDLWNSFTINDLIHPIDCFMRIIHKFGEPIGRLITFVIEIVKIVIEAILIVMNFPFDLINNIIAKAMQAFELIKKDPVKFLKNLLRAIKEGFMQFFDNILTHLWNGLKAWFLGEVEAAGIPIPTDFSVMGIIKWLLVVLDITMEKIWKKLEDRIGKEKVDKIKKFISGVQKVASAVGEAYQFVKDVQEKGFVTVITEKIKEKLSNVWDMVLDAVKNFVMEQIVNKVTAKLLSMLDPTGIMAVVNSAIALYKAIQSFIKYLRKMLEIVNSFVEGTLQIAQGATKKAADFLEGALARGVPIVIGFLANQIGLNLSERLKDALEWVRDKVDKGLTWVIDKLVTIVEKLVEMGREAIGGGGTPQEKLNNALKDGQSAVNKYAGKKVGGLLLNPLLAVIRLKYGLKTLEAVPRGPVWSVRGTINPEGELPTDAMVDVANLPTQGVLDLYRGINYKTKVDPNMTPEALEQQLLMESDFSDAVYDILGTTRFKASAADITIDDRIAAARIVSEETFAATDSAQIRQWWVRKTRARKFDNIFLAILQRFVNSRKAMITEMEERELNVYRTFTFSQIPFISTTKNPDRAATYAKGDVVAGTDKAKLGKRNYVVGKVFVYLFSTQDLVALQAADIRYLADQGAISPHARYSKADQEITFTGSIPQEHRVDEILVKKNDSVATAAERARSSAVSKASSKGGLQEWS